MKKLLIAIILISSSFSLIAQEEKSNVKTIIQAKGYLSAVYQGATSTNATTIRSLFLRTPILGVAWKKNYQRNFQEVQLTGFHIGKYWNSAIKNQGNKSQLLEASYSYNFCFAITDKYVPYIGVGLQERFSNSVQPTNERTLTSITNLMLIPGWQMNLNDKWAIDFNIPLYLYQYQYISIKNSNIDFSGGLRNKIVGRVAFRLGVAYTL